MGNTLAWVLHYEAKNIQTLYQQAQKYYKERGGTQSLGDLPADWERLLESQHHTTVAPGSLLAHDSEYRIMEALSARFRAYCTIPESVKDPRYSHDVGADLPLHR